MISKLVKNAGALYLLQGVNVLAPFMVIPFLTRMLSVSEFAVVMIVFATLQMCFVITDYGFSLSATYEISKKENDVKEINRILGGVFAAKMPLILIALAILMSVTLHPSYSEYKEVFYAGIITVIAQALQPLWFFHGVQKMIFYSVYMSLSKIIYVLLVLLLVSKDGDGWLVIMSWSIANLCGALAALVSIWHLGYSIQLSSVSKTINVLREGAQFFWSRVAVACYTSIASLLVGMFSLHQAAMFSASEQIYKSGQAATSPVNQALYPYMVKEKNWNIFFKIQFLLLVTLIIGVAIIYSWRSEIVKIIFGDGYEGAVPILSVFLMTNVVSYIGVSFGYPACGAINRTDVANKSVLFGFLLFLIFITMVFFWYEVTGINVALCILGAELIVMVSRSFFVFRYLIKNDN